MPTSRKKCPGPMGRALLNPVAEELLFGDGHRVAAAWRLLPLLTARRSSASSGPLAIELYEGVREIIGPERARGQRRSTRAYHRFIAMHEKYGPDWPVVAIEAHLDAINAGEFAQTFWLRILKRYEKVELAAMLS